MILENFVNLNNVGYLLTWQNFVSWGLFHYRLYHGTRVGRAGGQVSFVVPLLNLTQV